MVLFIGRRCEKSKVIYTSAEDQLSFVVRVKKKNENKVLVGGCEFGAEGMVPGG